MAATRQNYAKLSPEARHLLQLCAVYHQGINRTQLVELSRKSGWKDADGGLLDYKKVSPKLSSLERDKLLVKQGSKLVVSPHFEDLVVQESVRDGEFDRLAKAVQEAAPPPSYYSSYYYGQSRSIWTRDMRIAFYRGDRKAFETLSSGHDVSLVCGDPSIDVLQPFDRQIFDMLDPLLQDMYLKEAIEFALTAAYGNRELIETIKEQLQTKQKLKDDQLAFVLNILLAAGDLDGLNELDKRTGGEASEVQGSIAVLRGEWDAALAHFNEAHARLRKKTRKRNFALPYLTGFLHAYLLLRENSDSARNQVRAITKAVDASDPRGLFSHAASIIADAVGYQACPTNDTFVVAEPPSTDCPAWCHLTAVYLWQWLNPDEDDIAEADVLEDAATTYRALGFQWLAAEVLAAASKLETKQAGKKLSQQAAQAHKKLGTVSLLPLMAPEPVWARSLNALAQVGQVKTNDGGSDANGSEALERMIWELEFYGSAISVTPLIQKRNKSGAWTKGRKVALERLYTPNRSDVDFDFLTDNDREICACIREEYSYSGYGRYREKDYDFDLDKVAPRLVGHPLVFRHGQRDQPLEVELREPQLVVKKMKNGKLRISLEPQPGEEAGVSVIEEGPHRLAVIRYTKDHLRLWEIVGGRLDVPASAQDLVLQTVGAVASLVTVHSEVGGVAEHVGESVAGDPGPHLHLLPYQQGLRAEFFVRPFDGTGPSYRPAQGGTNVFAEVEGKKKCAERDFNAELSAVQNVLSAVPELQRLAGEINSKPKRNGSSLVETLADLTFPTPIEALELMLELRPVAEAGQVTLHWPQGKAFNVVGQADSSQFRMNIRRDRDWFAASGKLQVDNKLTLDMMKLVELVEASPSRFVEIEEGNFIALTDRFRRRIEDLVAYSDRQKKKLRFPAIRAAALEDLGEEIQLKADEHWTQAVSRIRDAAEFQPQLPSTFQGELRDYQQEGFSWLARLARWGVGACLADDMGLGKTIQAIALLLDRAGDGPALVVAPTSVAFNWGKEITRFAPTLNPTLVSEADRAVLFDDLGPRDVVICSYGLLHHEAERLQAQPWHTVVLDEAQAIKNTATKRSQAAMKLEAGFRLIMTGTPLENHLGELWNLMQFINPGLLGSLEMFNQRFAIPIERDQCRATRQRLKKLIQPFILRRTKTQVLDELPSRTEITLQVDLSEEEAAFYEALRMRAVDKLADSDDKKPQHIKILAEIMRLRRACCHPQLVMPESNVSSSKLDLFSDTIDELLDGGHKVLVFSQFVDHLSILRKELDQKGVSYQYLDGSTTARQRKNRVEAFQAGEGDVFLISLKAGGLGLNLTAADYVIHMDPWWNPAVEDQASDRAHRLGQTRPVTIYRFVTQGTIEERIVDLHRTKRDLADSLLEGTDMSGKLSADELLKLLSE